MLLAIDTSAGTSVAVVDRGMVLADHGSADTRRHAEMIGQLIEACLSDAAVAVTALAGVAVGMGPGPFTGLRVGIAAARAFGFGAGIPVIPVVSHDAIAFDALHARPTTPLVVATDARRHEVYWSVFTGLDAAGLPICARAPALAKAVELTDIVAGFECHALIEARTVSAAALGMVAEARIAHGRPAAADEPLYLRSPDVTLSAGPKRVTG
jgi:tRNA threonylcarbamoyl adenosine modification protein YeaZ